MRGRPRAPGKVLAQGLLTFGFGFAWYYFQAFREVDVQAGRRHSPLFFLAFVPIVGPLFGLWYLKVETRGLDESRRSVGLPRGLGPWRHATLIVLGALAAQLLAFPVWAMSQGWLQDEAWLLGLGITAWFAPVFAAPVMARSVNEYWDALARRPVGAGALK